MRRRHKRQNTRVDDAQVPRAVDQQIRIDDAAEFERHHGRGAAGVVFRLALGADSLGDVVAARIRWREELFWSQRRHAVRCYEAFVERNCFLQHLDVDGVAAVAWVDKGWGEGLGRGEGDCAAAERAHGGDCEIAVVCVDEFEDGSVGVLQGGGEEGELGAVAC